MRHFIVKFGINSHCSDWAVTTFGKF